MENMKDSTLDPFVSGKFSRVAPTRWEEGFPFAVQIRPRSQSLFLSFETRAGREAAPAGPGLRAVALATCHKPTWRITVRMRAASYLGHLNF